MKSKLLGAVTVAALLLFANSASAVTISGTYRNTFVTNQDPAGIGSLIGVQFRLELPSFPSGGLNGTYTFADNLEWASIRNFVSGASSFFASSSQPVIPNPIDPGSYFTFTNNVITAWSIIGNDGMGHLESISGVHDYILEPNGAFAINTDSFGTWGVTGIPVPGPLAGAGLPGIMLFGGLLVWWHRKFA